MYSLGHKVAAFFGMIFSGLCWTFGLLLSFFGGYKIFVPDVFSKTSDNPALLVVMLAGGLGLIGIGYLSGKQSAKVFDGTIWGMPTSPMHGQRGRRGR